MFPSVLRKRTLHVSAINIKWFTYEAINVKNACIKEFLALKGALEVLMLYVSLSVPIML